jgi:hypothetical protein
MVYRRLARGLVEPQHYLTNLRYQVDSESLATAARCPDSQRDANTPSAIPAQVESGLKPPNGRIVMLFGRKCMFSELRSQERFPLAISGRAELRGVNAIPPSQ